MAEAALAVALRHLCAHADLVGGLISHSAAIVSFDEDWSFESHGILSRHRHC
ncbi:hypothetical protein EV128_101474 [Rhizobium azibense]|nr:hypothetical protein EV128_101474 [Rhizobium azibense]